MYESAYKSNKTAGTVAVTILIYLTTSLNNNSQAQRCI